MSALLATLLAGGKAMLGRNGLLLAVIAGLATFYLLADRSGASRGRAEATIEQGKADDEVRTVVEEARRAAVDPRVGGVRDPYARSGDAAPAGQNPGGGGQL